MSQAQEQRTCPEANGLGRFRYNAAAMYWTGSRHVSSKGAGKIRHRS